jgi:hypothetical protein
METQIKTNLISRWSKLAQDATPVAQLASVPKTILVDDQPVQWKTALVAESGRVIARSMRMEDAQFHSQAREAMLALCDYVFYVEAMIEMATVCGRNDIVVNDPFPLTFEEWIAKRGESEDDLQQ